VPGATGVFVVARSSGNLSGVDGGGGSRAPLLSLTLDPTTDHFQRFLTDTGETIYSLRISVTNDGEIGAKNVEVVAQELTVKGPDGLFTGDPVFLAMNLTRTHYSVFRRRPSSA
jgi:hypothetical protein